MHTELIFGGGDGVDRGCVGGGGCGGDASAGGGGGSGGGGGDGGAIFLTYGGIPFETASRWNNWGGEQTANSENQSINMWVS